MDQIEEMRNFTRNSKQMIRQAENIRIFYNRKTDVSMD